MDAISIALYRRLETNLKNSLEKTREIRVLIVQIKAFCEMIHEIPSWGDSV